MQAQRFDDAAQEFQALAQEAERLDLPAAPQLFLQARRALRSAGRESEAKPLLLRAFHLMDERHDPRLVPIGRRLVDDLRADGRSDLATALEAELGALPSAAGATTVPWTPAPRLQLPAKCPWCGGSVHTDEVDWSDPERPGCAYCGSPLVGNDGDGG